LTFVSDFFKYLACAIRGSYFSLTHYFHYI